MGTSFFEVYDAFLARIVADDQMLEEERDIVERDWREMLKMAIFRFKFPRVSLEYEEKDVVTDKGLEPCYFFKEELSNDEIQILALFMKHEQIKRCIASWENIRQLYADSDFSQANHLDKLLKLESQVAEEVQHAVGIYDRSTQKRPTELFKKLAGKKNAI